MSVFDYKTFPQASRRGAALASFAEIHRSGVSEADGFASHGRRSLSGVSKYNVCERRTANDHRECAVRELNPGSSLGKAMSYHWTNGARWFAPRIANTPCSLTDDA